MEPDIERQLETADHIPNILVLDDEESIVAMIESFLTMEGYKVIPFSEPGKAMEWLNTNRVDLVLTDLRMGDFNGIDVFKHTQKTQRDVVVIIMTAFPTLTNAIEVLRMGVYDYLLKPFSMDSLAYTIKRGLEKQLLSREVVQLTEAVSLYQVSEAIGTTIEIKELLNIILETALREVDAQEASIILWDSGDKKMKLEASLGLPEDVVKRGYVPRPNGIIEWVMKNNKPLMLHGGLEGTPFTGVKKDRGILSSMCVPIRAKGKVLGVLSVNRTEKTDPFTQSKMQALTIITSHAAQSIENARLYTGLYRDYISIIVALSKAVEARDPYTQGHNARVVKYSIALGRELDLPEDKIEILKVASVLHDIGKIGIPDQILLKPDKLTAEEYTIMKQHPVIGDKILEPIASLKNARKVIYRHHERMDGKGYPEGLKDDELDIPSRILIVGEVFDALVTKRAYKDAWPLQKVIDFLKENSGTHFAPEVVESMIKVLDKEGESFIDYTPPDLITDIFKKEE